MLGGGHPACIAGLPPRSRDLPKLYARKSVELFLKTIFPKNSFAIFTEIFFMKKKSRKTITREGTLTYAPLYATGPRSARVNGSLQV